MPSPDQQSAIRLLIGLALSIAAHLLLILSFGPASWHYMPSRDAPPQPLEVELRREAPPAPAAELAIPQPSDHHATLPVAAALPAVPRQAPAPREDAPPKLNLPLDRYYTVREVDVRASQLNEVMLVYPKLAYQMRIRGEVTLRIFINERGTIDTISILSATPPGVFEAAALTATRALRFSPAIKDGRSVKSQITIAVTFDPYTSIGVP